MSFPVFRLPRRNPAQTVAPGILTWLAAEPFRLLFLSGAVWSILGVSLWPLWYAQKLDFYPGLPHARIMIEVFGGAFVVGFLGTAGPRLVSAPALGLWELGALFILHTATGVLHLMLETPAADACFLAMLALLAGSLITRAVLHRREPPPPQMLLALTGLFCGITGALMWLNPDFSVHPGYRRLADLLVYQGLLLPPVLGVGAFLFPRIMEGRFGEPATPAESRRMLLCALATAVLITGSFPLEATGCPASACLLRAGTAAGYLLSEIRWRRRSGDPPRGSLARSLPWALITGFSGLAAAGFAGARHVALEHLLFISGFGLVILIVAGRVLFGHSGEAEGFSRRSGTARLITALALTAAFTRASADFLPEIAVSHHRYAAWLWGFTALLWLLWHRRRFMKREAVD